MKTGVIVRSPLGKTKNIGDYIQSVSQEQFFDHVDYCIEREKMDEFKSDEKVKVIMGAWFMTQPEHFPPSDSIDPLFVSFHMFPGRAERMLSPKGIECLKAHEPIGARDIKTKEILEEHGIKSYFSSCLTLTLGYKYKDTEKTNDIYFVDPYYELGGGKHTGKRQFVDAALLAVKHWRKICKFHKNFRNERSTGLSRFSKTLDRILMCASFYDSYSKSFSDEILLNAKYIKHRIDVSGMSEDEIFDYTRKLIRTYAKAKLVVTSRLHCGLPCLGIETPVIFVTSSALEKGKTRGAGRLSGNLELMNYASWTTGEVILVSPNLKNVAVNGKLSPQKIAPNPEQYKTYRDQLFNRVKNFIKE